MTIRVFLLDDHEVVRARACASCSRPTATSRSSARPARADGGHRARSRPPAPDVAVLDVRLPDGNGVEVCREVRSRAARRSRCLMLTSFADDEALFDAIMAGASGYVLKQIRGNDLVDAIRRVAAGQSLLDPAVTARVLDRLRCR